MVRLVELIPYYIDLVWALQAQLPSNKSKTYHHLAIFYRHRCDMFESMYAGKEQNGWC